MFSLFVIGAIVGVVGLFYVLRSRRNMVSVAVVVLGDIGRSPRMQYHALSLAKNGFQVRLIGYGGSTPHKDIMNNKQIFITYLIEPPSIISAMPRLLVYILKAVWQIVTLSIALIFCRSPSHILLQNPPAIPTLAVCWIISLLRNICFIVDWHNYGHTILSLTIRKSHPIVKFATCIMCCRYESFFGKMSTFNICVTKAMKADLQSKWGVQATVMYDRPPSIFKKTNIVEKHALFLKLSKEYPAFREKKCESNMTLFTQDLNGKIELRPNRPVMLISSTSWTEDEDFTILLDALDRYEDARSAQSVNLPDICCVLTGKGPQKQHYQSIIENRSWKHVTACMPWLEAEDYPTLLGAADLGVCLHTSSSGLDLPMKVVDMFGCGLPVCAIHFQCLDELVKHEHNGLVFRTAAELTKQIQRLLEDFPRSSNTLTKFRTNLEVFQQTRWDQAWNEIVKPMFMESC